MQSCREGWGNNPGEPSHGCVALGNIVSAGGEVGS
jgi:hypothetical protein